MEITPRVYGIKMTFYMYSYACIHTHRELTIDSYFFLLVSIGISSYSSWGS